jgi:O-antigen ligase
MKERVSLRSDRLFPEFASGGAFWFLTGLVVTVFLSLGVTFSPLWAVAPIALAVLGVMLFAPIPVGTFLLILLRTLSDSAVFSASLSSVLNIGIAGLAVLMVIVQMLGPSRHIRLGRFSILLLVGLFVFTVVGISSFGPNGDMLSDSLRLISVVSIVALATMVVRRYSSKLLCLLLLWASVPAALLTVFGFITHNALFYSSSTGRAFGSFPHPVAAAGYFSILAIVALFALLQYRQRISLVLFGVFALAALGTSSLGGLVTLAVGIGVLLILLGARTRGRNAVVVGVALIATVGLVVAGQSVVERIVGLTDTDLFAEVGQSGATNSTTWRFRNWLALLQFWQERPVLGWGYGATTTQIRPLGELPHSGPVKLLVETGTIGFAAAIIAVIGLVIVAMRKLRTADRNLAALQLAVLSAAMTNSLTSNTLTYIPMLIAIGVAWAVGAGEQSSTTDRTNSLPVKAYARPRYK